MDKFKPGDRVRIGEEYSEGVYFRYGDTGTVVGPPAFGSGRERYMVAPDRRPNPGYTVWSFADRLQISTTLDPKPLLKDGATYRGRFFVGAAGDPDPEWHTGILLPKGDTLFEHDRERSLEAESGTVYYVDPSTLTEVAPKPEEVSTRARVLREAEALITGDRNKTYGPPTQNFENIAQFWNTFLAHKLKDGEKITAGDTAGMQILVKIAREIAGSKEDNKTDIAGYSACWAEVDEG